MTVYRFSNVVVLDVHDGDTVRFLLTSDQVDLGFGMKVSAATSEWSCRMLGYAAREIADPGGPEARDALAAFLGSGPGLVVESVSWDKYGGRFDGRAFRAGVPIAGLMIGDGWAVPWNGRGPQPKPPWPRVLPPVTG